jgi:hypothetical protein
MPPDAEGSWTSIRRQPTAGGPQALVLAMANYPLL